MALQTNNAQWLSCRGGNYYHGDLYVGRMKPGKGISKAVLSAHCLAAIPGVAQFRGVRIGFKKTEWVISVTLREVSHHSG
jgi:hypothetical protein